MGNILSPRLTSDVAAAAEGGADAAGAEDEDDFQARLGGARAAVRPGALRRRFFIAAMVPESLTRPLAALENAGKGKAGWDWKRPADYHISLAFPGALTGAQVARVVTLMQRVNQPAFNVRFEGLSSFIREGEIKPGRLSVLWARPDPAANAAFLRLHADIARLLVDHRFAFGRPDVVPHLTLAKVPMAENRVLRDFQAAHNGVTSAAWRCDRFGLYETIERHDVRHPANNNGQGSRYHCVAEFKLR